MDKRKNRILPITYRGEEIDSSNHASVSSGEPGVNDVYLIDKSLNGYHFEISHRDDAIGEPVWNMDMYTHNPRDISEKPGYTILKTILLKKL